MKRIALLVVVFAAAAIGQDADIKEWADKFETDVDTIQVCLQGAQTSISDMQAINKRLGELEGDNLTDQIKKDYEKFSIFIACMLEKKEMMKDGKLVLDKLLESIEKDTDVKASKEVITECVQSLNDDNEMGREDRAFGLMVCLGVSQEDKRK